MNFLSWFEPDGNNTHVDHIFTASVILLTGWGLVTLYSASYYQAQRFFNNGLFFFSRQAILGICGIFLFLILSRINLQLFRKLIPFMVIGTLFICCLTFIPGLGVEKNGATRWIGIGRSSQNPSEPGITFQPSELIKLVMPFYLAHIFSKKGDSLNDFKRGILPPAIVLTVFFIIVYRQNNFSTAVFIALNALVIFFLAGVQKRWFAGAFIMLTPLAVLMVLTETHRLMRFKSFLQPQAADLRGAGYQIYTSLRAINSGGFWGKGLGQGTWKIAGIPEVHSDFIFASFAEETGFIGVILLVCLFGVFAYRGYRGALRNEDTFSKLLGFGLVTTIVSQALINLAVAVGALPTTGLPLPFFSAGGTYLAIVLIMASFIANVTRSGRDYGRG